MKWIGQYSDFTASYAVGCFPEGTQLGCRGNYPQFDVSAAEAERIKTLGLEAQTIIIDGIRCPLYFVDSVECRSRLTV